MGIRNPISVVEAYNTLLAEKFSPDYPLHIWSYPPHLLLFTWPLALLPYATAYVLYSLAGFILYLAVASEGRWRAEHLLLPALAPAVIVNIWCGQNGFFIAALLVGGLLQLDRRPVLAGVLFGALSIKPQLGVLLPVMLALTGRWRTMIAAAATILVLLGLTCLVFGTGVSAAYINDAMPTQAKVFLRDYENFMVHMPDRVHERTGGWLSARARIPDASSRLVSGRYRFGMDLLDATRSRTFKCAICYYHFSGDALCVQLRHGCIRMGDRQPARPGR